MGLSKNLTKLRNKKNISQEQLAQELFVTRQTVSSWERGRTQPDIETLIKISELLDVKIEQLIYGEKHYSDEASRAAASRKKLITVFTVIASVLTAAGIIFIFTACWQYLPKLIKTVFSILPLLAGQAAAALVYIKRRENLALTEISAALWCMGIIASVSLTTDTLQFCDSISLKMPIILLMIVPVIYILQSSIAAAVYLTGSLIFSEAVGRSYLGEYPNDVRMLIRIVLLAVVAVFAVKSVKKEGFIEKNAPSAIFLAALFAAFYMYVCSRTDRMFIAFGIITVLFLCIYIKDNPITSAISVLAILTASLTFIIIGENGFYYSTGVLPPHAYMAVFAFCTAVIAAALIMKRKKLLDDKLKAAFVILCCLLFLLYALYFLIFKENMVVYVLTALCIFALSAQITASGILLVRFSQLNIGLISMASVILFVTVKFSDLSMLAVGIILILFALVLLSINLFLYKKNKGGAALCEKEQK